MEPLPVSNSSTLPRPRAPLVARAWHADPVTIVAADGIAVVVRRRVADIRVTDEAVPT